MCCCRARASPLPHVLRRRHRSDCPGLVGLAEDADRCDEIRSALSYDIVMQKGTPAAVLAKSVVTLLASAAERQPAAARIQRRAYERATARHLSQLNAPG